MGAVASQMAIFASSYKMGWIQKGGHVSPNWMTLPDASKACQELIKCTCKQRCFTSCKCKTFRLECTELCKCSGQCYMGFDE